MPEDNIKDVKAGASPEVQPAPVTPEPAVQINPVQPNNFAKKSKKKLFIIIAIVAFVVIAIGSIVGYLSWFQSPEKVLSDAVTNMIKADTASYKLVVPVNPDTLTTQGFDLDVVGNITLTFKYNENFSAVAFDTTVDVEVDGKDKISLKANVIVDEKKDVYIKFSDINDLVTYLKNILLTSSTGYISDEDSEKMDELIGVLVEQIDGQWIKLSDDTLGEYNSDANKTKTCLEGVAEKYGSDNKVLLEIAKLYEKNKFVLVDEKLDQKDGSFGYKIEIDEKETEKFGKEIQDLDVFKAIEDCNKISVTPDYDEEVDDYNYEDDYDYEYNYDDSDTYSQPKTNTYDKENYSFEVWVDAWTHKFTKISITYQDKKSTNKQKTVIEVTPDYKTKIDIKTPSGSKDVKELMDDLQNAYEEYISTLYPEYPEYPQPDYPDDCYDEDGFYNYDDEDCMPEYPSPDMGKDILKSLFNKI